MPDLGNLLGSKGPDVQEVLSTLEQLNAPAGSGPFSFTGFKLTGGKGLTLLSQPVQITSGAQLTAEIGAAGADAASIFEDGDSWPVPNGKSLAVLDLKGNLGAAASGSTPLPAVQATLSFSLNASAQMEYRHLLLAPNSQTRLGVLTALVSRAQIPQLLSPTDLVDGEVHHLTALFSVGLGAEAALGKEIGFKHDLFPGLAPEISIHFQYAVKASLNASLYESLRWTVGKGAAFTVNPGWVRLRAQREHQRQLTLGAQFSLDVSYNFGSVLEALLNRALALNPVERAMAALKDIQAETALVAAGNFAAIEAQLGKVAADRIAEFLDPILADSAAVQKLISASGKVVSAYDNLGETLQSFWNGLLNRGDLSEQRQKLRALLTRIVDLPADPKALLTPQQQDLIPLIETLSGLSFEEIWTSSGAAVLLATVKADAKRALSFLDAVENLPDTVLARLQDFAKRTGIAGTVAWLQQNATSLPKLQAAADSRIQKLVETLLHKAFAAIDDQDRQKIQAWAVQLQKILAAPQALETELRAKLQQLDGTLGFQLGIEFDRLSRSSSLLDIEVDPTDKAAVKAVQGLAGRSFASILAALPVAEDNKLSIDPPALPFLIHECSFTSQRIRTSSASFFFSLFGSTSTNTRQRLTESALAVRQEGNQITRQGTYSGAFSRSTQIVIEKSGRQSTSRLAASIAWTAAATGAGADITAPYSGVGHRLRLTVTRDDDATQADELTAIGQLLADLGFVGDPGPLPAAANHSTRLALSIELGADALQAFLGDGTFAAPWNLDELNAAHRWFDEKLVPRTATELDPPDLLRGTVLAALTGTRQFQNGWTQLPQTFEQNFKGQTFPVTLADGTSVGLVLVRQAVAIASWGNFNMVRDLIARRQGAQKPMRAAAKAFGTSGPGLDPGDLADFGDTFARAADAVSPGFWDNPAFALWLVLARVARAAPSSLTAPGAAAGLASFRSKDEVTGLWGAPQRWTLDPSRLPKRTPGQGIFPLG
jgi:hypothetical protein